MSEENNESHHLDSYIKPNAAGTEAKAVAQHRRKGTGAPIRIGCLLRPPAEDLDEAYRMRFQICLV
jgi:hypothetical protein